jgi:hypothetical protein
MTDDPAPDTAMVEDPDLVYCIYADIADVTADGRGSLMKDLEALGIDIGAHVSLSVYGRLAVENISDRQYRLCRELLRRCPEIRVTDVVVPEGVRP